MQLFRIWLPVLLLLLSLLPVSHAQDNNTPPPLLLLIVVDDSSTMNSAGGSLNSIETPPNVEPLNIELRDVTDDGMERWRFVGRLLTTLHADTGATHQVAVMSFDGISARWVFPPDDPAADNPFVTLGSAGDDAGFNTLLGTVTRPQPGQRPGDTLAALQTVENALETWTTNNSAFTSLKPVVLLITDDVPVESYGDSPFTGVTNGGWLAYDASFRETVERIRGQVSYEPEFCRHAGGGVSLVSVPMGAANWVTPPDNWQTSQNGSPPSIDQTFGRIDQTGNGQYFQQLADSNGFYRLNEVAREPVGSVLVYPVDPLLSSPATLTSDLFEAFNAFQTEMRCMDATDITGERAGSETVYQIDSISAFMPQFQLIFDEPAATRVQVTAPDGETVTPQDAGVRVVQPENSTYQVWSFDRDTWLDNDRAWTGPDGWRINAQNSITSRLRLAYYLNLDGLSWQVMPGQQEGSATARLQLLMNGTPFVDEFLLEAVELSLTDLATGEERIETMRLNPETVSYSYAINNASEFELQPRLIASRIIKGTDIDSGDVIRLSEPDNRDAWIIDNTSDEPGLVINEPPSTTDLQCDDGRVLFDVSLTFGLQRADPNQLASLVDGVTVSVLHRFASQPDDTAVEIGQLNWNLSTGSFSGAIDCSILDDRAADVDGAGPDQIFSVNAVLPRGETIAPDTRSVVYLTPTPQPVVATPQPTPIPQPPRVNLIEESREFFLEPPAVYVFAAAALLLVLGGLWWLIQSYLSSLALRQVWIETYVYREDDRTGRSAARTLKARRKAVSGWQAYVPQASVPITFSDDRTGQEQVAFDLHASASRLSGVARVELMIGRTRYAPDEPFDIFGEQTLIRLRGESREFKIIDYNTERATDDNSY